jgi:predicted RNase H-like nuclease (RuvC/YqgF family)
MIIRDEIYKLKMINDKLKEQLKMLSLNLDQALDKIKFKNKKTNFYDIEEKAKDKELQGIDVQIAEAQKTIKTLKCQIESNPGLDKYIVKQSN